MNLSVGYATTAPSLKRRLLTRRHLTDGYENCRRLTDGYDNRRRFTDACGHIYKKNCILVVFDKFKKRNPRVVGFFSRILDRNVVVFHTLQFESVVLLHLSYHKRSYPSIIKFTMRALVFPESIPFQNLVSNMKIVHLFLLVKNTFYLLLVSF